VAEINRDLPPQSRMTLYDFTAFAGFAVEPVPDEPERRMAWFIDSSHATPAAGRLVLKRLFGGADAPDVPVDFGRALTPGTIEADIAAMRSAHDAYKTNFPLEVAHVRALVAETEPIRLHLRAQRLANTPKPSVVLASDP
jgi:hypothetical protein